MRILDRYILKKVVLSYFFVLLSFIGLHLIIDLFSHLGDFLRTKTPFHIILNYYVYLFPLIFLRTSTFSLPISILFSLGELNKNNEITTMRASGISVFRLSKQIILFSILLSFLALFLQEKILIYSQKKSEDIKIEFVDNIHQDKKIEKNFVFRNKNKLFFVSKFLPKDYRMEGVTILEEDEDGFIKEKIVCQNIIYDDDKWKIFESISYQLDKEGKIISIPTFLDELELDLDEKPQAIIFKKSSFSQYTPLNELRKEIKRLKRTASSTFLNNLIIDYHKKIVEPFSHFFLAVGILPFALEIKKRKVGLSALGGGFIFGFLYYLILSISIALGKAGILIAPLSSWVAPLFFLAMGISGIILIR